MHGVTKYIARNQLLRSKQAAGDHLLQGARLLHDSSKILVPLVNAPEKVGS